jgi:hypothetical protein
MAYREIDIEDIAALVALPVFAGIELNVFTFAVDVFGGYSFGDPLFSLAGMGVTLSLLATVAALAWIYATNELDGSQYSDEEKYAMGGAILIVPLYAAVPAFRKLINSNDLFALLAWLAIATFAVYISYAE